ncbi:alpha/beta fold hydrolase [Nonomuraea sp. SYSU D8015]|uniref:alpha/beta fold hydrolase n=1 Tax=Nonomuraea sp. SYSU D8015 TaxID=2593644 RepID=UPI0016608261|nr:alpha/beta hydrolase [Nonomuraea sp. SYSU D8015]
MNRWQGHEFTAAAGTRVHAAVLGSASALEVVCVHGLGCSHRYFLPLARCLAPAYRVVVPDLPGFGRTRGGRSPLDIRGLSLALADWLRATHRRGVPLVANSVGCQIVVDLAVHSPDLLGSVVLNGPTMDGNARTWVRQVRRWLADGWRERPALALVLARDYLDCGPRRLLNTFRAALADPIERKLHHVHVPAVVVRGTKDPIVTHEWVQEVVRRLPRGRLAEVPGAAHTLNFSAPAELARIVTTLLENAGSDGATTPGAVSSRKPPANNAVGKLRRR